MERYGPGIEDPNDLAHQRHLEFLAWAVAYDSGGLDTRSRSLHEEWISILPCPVVQIEGDMTIQENLKKVLNMIFPNQTIEATS